MILCGITARGFYKTESFIHPTELPILLELPPDVYITTQCTHVPEWHYLSGDFQVSETRRTVRQTATFVCSWRHLSFLLQCYPWLSYLLANLICTLLLIANVILRKTCINPCQSSVPKSRKCHYTCQTSSLHKRTTISLSSLSDILDNTSIQYHLLVSLSFFWGHYDISRDLNRIFYYK